VDVRAVAASGKELRLLLLELDGGDDTAIPQVRRASTVGHDPEQNDDPYDPYEEEELDGNTPNNG
jgi:hypothetical protein